MSYAKGRLLLAVMVGLMVHFILGGVAYYRIFRLEKTESALQKENEELKVQNKKIERIAKEFQEIRLTDEKIRRAFGGSLGLVGQSAIDLENLELPATGRMLSSGVPVGETSPRESRIAQIQNRLSFLSEKSGDYFDPEHLPTLLPVEGFLTTHFQKGGWFVGRSHYGIDIAAKKGSVIRAAGAGVVLFADWTPDFGNVVVVAHGNGFFSYYAHAMRLLVDQGFRVRKGHPIALLGSSGISSAPHLHFEIWKDGEPLDPEKFIFALHRREVGKGP